MTMSFGVAASEPGEGFEYSTVLATADMELYRAKEAALDSLSPPEAASSSYRYRSVRRRRPPSGAGIPDQPRPPLEAEAPVQGGMRVASSLSPPMTSIPFNPSTAKPTWCLA